MLLSSHLSSVEPLVSPVQGNFSAKKRRPWVGEVHLVIVSLFMIKAPCIAEITGASLAVVMLIRRSIVSIVLIVMSPFCL